ncbi:DNA replication and repair protein RecF, partial [bacterium]|nr:DNA replication and repair protein RecF [bacterium]
FRSYTRFNTVLSEKLTIVVGPNAVGKTNLIEALQLVTTTESFRRPRWEDLLPPGAQQGLVAIEVNEAGGVSEIEMRISAQTGREYRLNGKRKRPHEIVGRIPSVVFTPDDLYMIKGPAEERRRAVDEAGDQLSASYAALRRDYVRVVKQRNAALKSTGMTDHIGDLDDLLITTGARLTAHRARLSGKIAQRAAIHYKAMSGGEELQIEATPSWEKYSLQADAHDEEQARACLTKALGIARTEERARGLTMVGPHRDDIRFLIGGSDARKCASQGQQRTVALVWKLAELDVIQEVSGNRPLLLLDDVMSELDKKRRSSLADLVLQGTQTVITTANLDYFETDILAQAQVL